MHQWPRQMKLLNIFAILSVTAVSFVPISATPVADDATTPSSNAQVGTGIAPIVAQFYPGVIAAVAQLSPVAAQGVTAGIKQACDSVKDLNTSGAAQIPEETVGSSILSPITNAVSSFVSSVLPNFAPFLTAIMAVATGDTSAAPSLVAAAQQTCDIVFNGSA